MFQNTFNIEAVHCTTAANWQLISFPASLHQSQTEDLGG